MAKQFLIGDDGVLTWGGTEVDSVESVTFNRERSEIEKRDRGSDKVAHRAGKDKRTLSLEGVVKPNDAGLAAMETDYDNNDEGALIVKRDTDDELENANYIITSLNEDEPLEENQSFSVELSYHSEVTS